MDEDPAFQAHAVLRSGYSALTVGMFGMGWLGWGLGTARAFTPAVIALFDVFGIALLVFSIYIIRQGRTLRRMYPASTDARIKQVDKQFIAVVTVEFAAIAILTTVAYALHRPDLTPALAAIVVGLHFLPLGKIFRQARYYFWGTALALWCTICAILFRSNTLVEWSTIGTGILLWANCAHGLLRARGLVRALTR